MLPIQVNGIKGTAIADSGSEACIASQSLYREGVHFEEEELTISYADSVPQQKKVLKTTMHVGIANRIIRTTFYVLPDQAEGSTTLLGVDFLEEANITLCQPQRTWFFTDEPEQQFPYLEEAPPNGSATKLAHVTLSDLRQDEGPMSSDSERAELNALLKYHEDAFSTGGEATPFAEHCIDTEDHSPISLHCYKLSPKKKGFFEARIRQIDPIRCYRRM